jgi:hypothetical protein
MTTEILTIGKTEIDRHNIILENLYVMEYTQCFFNTHKKFGTSLSIDITSNPNAIAFFKLFNDVYNFSFFKSNKDNTKQYIHMKVKDETSYFDHEKKRQDKFDEDELYKNNDMKIMFKISKFDMKGMIGFSIKALQIQYRPRQQRFSKCLF